MNTNTPLDACPHCGAFLLTHHTPAYCEERTARQKAEAEVERLKAKFCGAIEIADKYRERISCVINEDCDWSMHDTHREFNEIKGTLNQDKK